MFKGFKPVTVFANSSILDDWRGPEYVSLDFYPCNLGKKFSSGQRHEELKMVKVRKFIKHAILKFANASVMF